MGSVTVPLGTHGHTWGACPQLAQALPLGHLTWATPPLSPQVHSAELPAAMGVCPSMYLCHPVCLLVFHLT